MYLAIWYVLHCTLLQYTVSYLQFVHVPSCTGDVVELSTKGIQGDKVLCQAWHPCWQYTHIPCKSPCFHTPWRHWYHYALLPPSSTSSTDAWYSSINVRIEFLWCVYTYINSHWLLQCQAWDHLRRPLVVVSQCDGFKGQSLTKQVVFVWPQLALIILFSTISSQCGVPDLVYDS